jgi:hypothetical protein
MRFALLCVAVAAARAPCSDGNLYLQHSIVQLLYLLRCCYASIAGT